MLTGNVGVPVLIPRFCFGALRHCGTGVSRPCFMGKPPEADMPRQRSALSEQHWGLTMTSTSRQFCHRHDSQTQKARSADGSLGRFTDRLNTANCCRSARFSAPRADRLRKNARMNAQSDLKPHIPTLRSLYPARHFVPCKGDDQFCKSSPIKRGEIFGRDNARQTEQAKHRGMEQHERSTRNY